ncbi:hypothetical protein JCM30471_09950 [Desulfuromonas carbonis]|uniref:Ig-like domain-containing protein n=1 Tax=Desulfuromonas sp. DDH964 TaxID=1823759 RepID=UPI00078EF67E|nr:Ig-like domain-containing protein [Desulfuromonas sp. DDH964]AMV72478.1 laccase family multicopper oxidase [Desulfuromonas sp. DDH964]
MRKTGQLMMRTLGLVVLLLTAWCGSAFAAGTVSPELAAKIERIRSQQDQRISNQERQAAADSLKALREQIHLYRQQQNDPTKRTKGGGGVTTQGLPGVDFDTIPTGPNEFLLDGRPKPPDYFTTANWAFTPPIAKFVDTLSDLSAVDANGDCIRANNLGQCLPVAVPDTVTYPGADYYEISLREWSEVMHSDMPLGTPVRGYIQTNDGTAAGATNCSNPLPLGDPNFNASDNTCNTVAPPNKGHFLGPIIIAQRDRPVRLKFTNELPADTDGLPDASGHRNGDLFIPVDETVMGAGAGPSYPTGTRGVVSATQCNHDDPLNNSCEFFSQNRATVHLHGGRTPWISDGTPHQWITPKDENTPYPQGVSVAMVPDMPNPGDGSMTFYYSNQQTARLMFYHDHAFGITRLNVLAGMAAGYVIQDEYEKDLAARDIIPGDKPDEMIALVMQDRTFVDATPVPNPQNNNVMTPRVRVTDPLWNWGTGSFAADGVTRNPKTGDLWMPHVYMPAQNPHNPDGSGANPFGRWMYGPWFYPPTVITHPPVANPYYDADCESTDPVILANCQTPGQPPLMPDTPHPSMGMEAFFDSWVVNGTTFPRLEVEPKAYRFRILNAANDRGLNLSIYKADSDPANMSPVTPGGTLPFSGQPVPAGFDPKTEVKMVPASATAGWPADWPIDGRDGGVPDPGTYDPATGRWSNWGPSWVQIGTDAGFLPQPAIRDPQPITWRTDPTAFWVGNVYKTALGLMPAERADVIVDFSKYAGQTLIVYNDAPAAWPAGVFNYDYWTGAPDYRDSGGYGDGGTFNAVTGVYDGGHGPLPGLAPNTRTVMQIKVGTTVSTPSPLNMDALKAEFTTAAPATTVNPNSRPLFERAMEPAIVAQTAYNEAYGKTFPPNAPWRGVRDSINDGHIFKFQTIDDKQVSVLMKPKGIHDEMGASFDPEYGRMSGNLAIEIQPPQTNNANLNLYGYSDVPTEIVDNSTTPDVQVDVLGQLADGTQIWNVSHNGVDTHPIHFHIFDVQLINRLGWDNLIEMPLPNELGWKDTIRISPLEDTIVAVRPVAPALPFGVPDSIRPLNPAIPIGSKMGFSNVDPVTGQAYAPPSFWASPDPNAGPAFGITGVHNVLYNFGWEYVWHCHILSHEEMDMMRPIILQVNTLLADAFSLTRNGAALSWTDPTQVDYTNYPNYLTGSIGSFGNPKNEIGYYIWRSDGGTATYKKVGSALANQTSFTDPAPNADPSLDTYVIEAYTQAGSTYSSPLADVTLTITPSPGPYVPPANLTLTTAVGAPLNTAGTLLSVEYFEGTAATGYTSLGMGVGANFSFSLANLQPGTYNIVAVVNAEVPDPIPGNNGNSAVLYAASAPQQVVVSNTLVTMTAKATVPANPANLFGEISVCDTTTLTVSDPNQTATTTYSWLVNGVTYAGATVVVPALPAGTYPVVLTVTDAGSSVNVNGSFTVVAHAPTITSAGGPYTLNWDSTFTDPNTGVTSPAGYTQLIATAAATDACANTLTYAWDINNDGIYDFTNQKRSLRYSVAYQMLGQVTGSPMTLRVTDSKGAAATLATTISVGPPPTLAAPATITVPATSTSGSFTVSWGAVTGTGVTYTLEESTDNFATSSVVATGITTTSQAITKVSGLFYYRVKADAPAAVSSAWTTGGNGCSILITALTTPAANATFNPGAGVNLAATATTTSAYAVSKVDFYDGATLIGTATGAGPYAASYSPTGTGTHSLKAITTYVGGTTSTSGIVPITVTGVDAPAFTLAPLATSYVLGSTITLTAVPAAVTGDPTATVNLVAFFDGATAISVDMIAPYTFDWAPTTLGTKSVTAVVYYSNGMTATSPILPLSVVPPPVTGVTYVASPTSPQLTGTSVSFTATATGGGANLEYQLLTYAYDAPTPFWTTAVNWQTSPTLNWDTSLAAGAGRYRIEVRVRNVGSTALFEARNSSMVYTLQSPTAVSSVTYTASPVSPQAVGTSVNFTAVATGGGASLEYQLLTYAYDAATPFWTTAVNWQTSPILNWNTNLAAGPGRYRIEVRVRTVGSTALFEARNSSMVYTLQSPTAVTSVTYTASPVSPQAVGTSVNFTAVATGGGASLEYQLLTYAYDAATPFWTTAVNWQTSPILNWNTNLAAGPGRYRIEVRVRTVGSTALFEARNSSMVYTLQSPTAVTSVTYTASPVSPQAVGTSVNFTAVATGGGASLEYQLLTYAYDAATPFWTTAVNWQTSPILNWNTNLAAGPGRYRIEVRVRTVGSTALFEARNFSMVYTLY